MSEDYPGWRPRGCLPALVGWAVGKNQACRYWTVRVNSQMTEREAEIGRMNFAREAESKNQTEPQSLRAEHCGVRKANAACRAALPFLVHARGDMGFSRVYGNVAAILVARLYA